MHTVFFCEQPTDSLFDPSLPSMSAELCSVGRRERWQQCRRVSQRRGKRALSQSKVRQGREAVVLQEWGCNQVSISVCASLGSGPASADCACVCVCVYIRELQGVLDYCSKAWVSIFELSPFPLHGYPSVDIKPWPFGGLTWVFTPAVQESPLQNLVLLSFISIASSEDGALETLNPRGREQQQWDNAAAGWANKPKDPVSTPFQLEVYVSVWVSVCVCVCVQVCLSIRRVLQRRERWVRGQKEQTKKKANEDLKSTAYSLHTLQIYRLDAK